MSITGSLVHDAFQTALAVLDWVLTDKIWEDCLHTLLSQRKIADPEALMDGPEHCYYLSDGGYSRVHFSDQGKIALTSNSRQEVKDRWKDAVLIRNKIEEILERSLKNVSKG